MMNKYPIVALVLLLAGIALVLNSAGISCPFAGENRACQVNGSYGEDRGINCGENCTGPNGSAGTQNNSTQENCSALGSCPVKNR